MSASTATSSQRALHALYVDHHGWLQGWLRRKLGCADNAADLAHDTFLRILQKREPQILREPRAYLTTIARGLVINLWQRQALERVYLEELALLPESEAPSEESRLLIFEALLQIESLLRTLPPAVRSAFLLSQLDGLGYAEIADRLGISTRTVKRHMVVAFEQCLQALA
jgi:RNA polymerase sigma-19 factor, ECF subfamily